MTSSISPDYSPTSNYSFPTDLSLSSSPTGPSRQHPDQIQPPRLSSPHIFRDIFAGESAGPSTRSPPRLPPLHEINFNETMQDVNRALQSANRAIQTAQEAFQSRRTLSTNTNRRQDVVDLTNSPPSPSRDNHSAGSFLTRTLHPHDSRPNGRIANNSLNEPYYPNTDNSTYTQSLFVEEDDPTSRYAGQSDSLAGARRRFENLGGNGRRSYFAIPNMERTLIRSGYSDARRHEEEEAIRRQRVAREQWEHNQQRQQQRDRLQQQRDRILAGQRGVRNQTQIQPLQENANASSAGTTAQSGSSPPRPSSSGSSSSKSSIESVDLTSVNNTTDLAAALLHSQASASGSVVKPTGMDAQPRTALTGYKCPICLEPPRNATSTICGHLFCHECILETLKNSENMRREEAPPHRKVKGQCPVCRKELARREDEGVGRTLVSLEIKLISKKRMAELERQARKRQRRADKHNAKGKGKEKLVADADGNQIFDLSSEGEDEWGTGGSSQKENRAKRVKISKSEEADQELFGAFLQAED